MIEIKNNFLQLSILYRNNLNQLFLMRLFTLNFFLLLIHLFLENFYEKLIKLSK